MVCWLYGGGPHLREPTIQGSTILFQLLQYLLTVSTLINSFGGLDDARCEACVTVDVFATLPTIYHGNKYKVMENTSTSSYTYQQAALWFVLLKSVSEVCLQFLNQILALRINFVYRDSLSELLMHDNAHTPICEDERSVFLGYCFSLTTTSFSDSNLKLSAAISSTLLLNLAL